MLSQLVHTLSLSDHRIVSPIFERLRRLVAPYHDPIIRYNLCGSEIAINFSHQLPFYRKANPTYSANLFRLASFIRKERGHLKMIDVGANVGDSYCISRPEPEDRYLLIEGDDTYFRLLKRNIPDDPAVECVKALLSDRPSTGQATLVSEGGTARVATGTQANGAVAYETLDRIIESHPGASESNLLKTDVDGYDCRVLRGGLHFINSAAPILFFEHHPRLLRLAGEVDDSIFAELAARGYEDFIVYDNFGYLLTCVSSSDIKFLKDLINYALYRDYYYYDICCFPKTREAEQARFLDSERAFFAAGAAKVDAPAIA
jgi:FkbM family methyltransferase